MSPARRGGRIQSRDFPRVSGDEPLDALAEVVEGTFSPRERG